MNKNSVNEVTKEKKRVRTDTCGLPFVPSDETLEAAKEALDIIAGRVKAITYSSFDEMWDDINGED